jgi:heme-degrading monooxygenase HmoA
LEAQVILVVFRSRFSDDVDGSYDTTERHLAQKVRELAGDDLVHLKNYRSEDGERLALVWWRSAESLEKWRNDTEHQDAQRRGKERWYSFYELSVAEVTRTSSSEDEAAYPSE